MDPSSVGLSGALRLVRDQRVAFVLVGAGNTLLSLVWFALAYQLFGRAIGYMGALVVAYVLGVLCGFVLHRTFVFRVRGRVWGDLVRFTSVHVGALAANAAMLPLAVEVAGLPVVPAQALVMVVTVVGSYLGHRWFSFRRAGAA